MYAEPLSGYSAERYALINGALSDGESRRTRVLATSGQSF